MQEDIFYACTIVILTSPQEAVLYTCSYSLGYVLGSEIQVKEMIYR